MLAESAESRYLQGVQGVQGVGRRSALQKQQEKAKLSFEKVGGGISQDIWGRNRLPAVVPLPLAAGEQQCVYFWLQLLHPCFSDPHLHFTFVNLSANE